MRQIKKWKGTAHPHGVREGGKRRVFYKCSEVNGLKCLFILACYAKKYYFCEIMYLL